MQQDAFAVLTPQRVSLEDRITHEARQRYLIQGKSGVIVYTVDGRQAGGRNNVSISGKQSIAGVPPSEYRVFRGKLDLIGPQF